jgi:hypothetical protein
MGNKVSEVRYCVCIFLLSHACCILRLSNPPSYEHTNDWRKVHPRDLSSSEVTASDFTALRAVCFIRSIFLVTFKQVTVITSGEACCRWQEHDSLLFTLVCLVFLLLVGSLTDKTPVNIPRATVLIVASKTA